MKLPEELEDYRDDILETVRPAMAIETLPGPPGSLWTSKFGGYPYQPKAADYPLRGDGRPLFLLAQINFSEAPKLELFPTEGLLQFFISDDDLHGLDFEHPTRPNGFRVRYFSKVDADEELLKTDFGFLPRPIDLPIRGSYALRYRLIDMPITTGDYRINGLPFDEDEVLDCYFERFPGYGHRLGGYPSFTQQDPREGVPEYQDYELLLQMDTDDRADIMWGDAGVGTFFIEPEALVNLDFSQVLYSWDCA